MNYRAWFQVHRWISVGLGLLLVFWLASGMVMVLPMPGLFYRGPGTSGVIPPFDDYAMAPAAAADRGREIVGAPPTGITWERLRDGMVYVVRFAEHPPVVLDAATGTRVHLTPELAEAIARDVLGSAVPLRRVDTVTRPSTAYAYGERPAWRLQFGDRAGSVAYVNQATGAVHFTTRNSRFKTWAAEWHLGRPLIYGGASEFWRHLAVWSTGVLTLTGLVAGVFLVLPRRWLRQRDPASG
jgi:hypothetical protein